MNDKPVMGLIRKTRKFEVQPLYLSLATNTPDHKMSLI